MGGVIEADHYREEAERLAAHPAILMMFDQLPEEHRTDETMNSWAFTEQASRHAAKLGVDARSIGGPARALRLLRDRSKAQT